MFSRFMMTLPVFIGQFFKFALIVAFIGAASHYVGQLLPRKNFDFAASPYASYKWEQDGVFYTRFRIQFWKDKVPDMSQYVKSMFRKKISVFRDFDYIKELILETCVAEFVHWMLVFISPHLPGADGRLGRTDWRGALRAGQPALCHDPALQPPPPRAPYEPQKRQDLADNLQ